MPVRLLLLIFLLTVRSLFAQAPGTVQRGDIDGRYRRPDLIAPLFNAAEAQLSDRQTESILRSLVLIARNFPDNPAVSHRLRARALALALRLREDDRSAVVANGQLARGITPDPVVCEPPATREDVAAALCDHGISLVQSPGLQARRLGLLLLDLTVSLDPRLRRKVASFTYLATPAWYEDHVPGPSLEVPRTFDLRVAASLVLLPGLREGALQLLTVRARTVPAPGRKGLGVALPAPLLQAMAAKNGADLRTRVEQRMAALRTAFRLRHESWPDGWSVEFEATGAPADSLPALFAGMALTLDALLCGEPLDEKCLLAAGVDEAGRLLPAVPAGELLPVITSSGDLHSFILPARSVEEVTDWLLLNPDRWPLLFRITLHRSADLDNALVLARQTRPPRLAQALSVFDALAARLTAAEDPLTELRKPGTVAQLREVLTWHEGHLSAMALLRVAEPGNVTLSVRGSLARIDALAQAILSTDRKRFPLHERRGPLAKSEFKKAVESLQANVRMLHPDVHAYLAEVVELGKRLDRADGHWRAYLKENGSPDPPAVAARRGQVSSARALLDTALKNVTD
jgi:hypothetical protein